MGTPKHIDLKALRASLGITQAELADLIGVSHRTVQSCEQGWRNPSPGVEKASLLLLLARRHGSSLKEHRCWEAIDCPESERNACIVFQTKQGHLCWMLSGNVCQGKPLQSWADKKASCFSCSFLAGLLPQGVPVRPREGE